MPSINSFKILEFWQKSGNQTDKQTDIKTVLPVSDPIGRSGWKKRSRYFIHFIQLKNCG